MMFRHHPPASVRRARAGSHRRRPKAEVLEQRRLLTGPPTLDSEPQIFAFAGVGFALNPITQIHGTKNGVTDNNAADYQVQINWGDGGGTDTSAQLVSVGTGVLVKGTHLYQTPKSNPAYSVTVTVTGPDGTTAATATTSVRVTLMPDAASQPPNVPASYGGAQPLGTVSLSLDSEPQIFAYAGVGFGSNPVTQIHGSYKGQTDNTTSDYHAQINWGDSPQWDAQVGLTALGVSGVLVKGTHIYQATGTYDVTLYVTGPDGQTISATTTSVNVRLLPDLASRPPSVPTAFAGAQPLAAESLSLDSEPQIFAFAGVGFALNPVTQIHGTYKGQTDNTTSDYHAQINWGDSPQWDAQVGLTALGVSGVLVKGTHIYRAAGIYDVTLYVTGPDGQTISATTASVNVNLMPDLASRPPSVPASLGGPQPLAAESLSLDSEPQIRAFAGVGFALNPVTQIHGTYNGQTDNTTGDYQAQINWGDSPQWDAQVGLTALGVSGVLVKGTHIYQAAGNYDVTLYVTGPDGQTISAITASVNVTLLPDGASRPPDVPTAFAGARPLAAESLSLDSEPQIFAYAGVRFALSPVTQIHGTYNGFLDSTPGHYRAQVNWGDGPRWDTNTTLSSTGSAVLVSDTHVYQDPGNYDVTLYVTGPDGQTISATTTRVNVSPLLISPSPRNISATEGTPFTGIVASFTVNDSSARASDFTAMIDYGDGTTASGTITANSRNGFDVTGTHTYADEGSSVPVAVTITACGCSSATATTNGTADVAEADTLSGNPMPVSATEGVLLQGQIATFSNTGYPKNSPTDFTALIDWGDGTSGTATVGGGNGTFTLSASHTYLEEGTFTLKATLTDDNKGTNSTTLVTQVNVADSSLTATPKDVDTVEGVPFTGAVATFTDTNTAAQVGDFTALIQWDATTTTMGTITAQGGGNFTVSGTHTFPEEMTNPVPFTVTITDKGGATATANSTARVADAILTARGANLTATSGTPFTGTVATFTDMNIMAPVSDFTVTIDWGDGTTSNGTVTAQGGGSFAVTGTHTYFYGCPAALTVTIKDDGGAMATATSTITLPGIIPLPAPPPAPNTPAPALPLNTGTWQPIGPAPVLNGLVPGGQPVSGRITGIATSPSDPRTIYVATAGGGVWKTTDGAATWRPLTDNQPTLFMGAIALAPSNPNVVYAGTGEASGSGDSFYGRGVLVSTDGGASWTLQNNGGAFTRTVISKIVVDPTDPMTVYAAVAGAGINGDGTKQTGIWKSGNGGTSWTNTTAAAGRSTMDAYTDLVIDPATPMVLYAAIGTPNGSAANGIYTTTNGGGTWPRMVTPVTGAAAGRITLAIAPSAHQTLYATVASPTDANGNSQLLNMLVTTATIPGVIQWTTLTSPPNFLATVGWYDSGLAVDPSNPNRVFVAGTPPTLAFQNEAFEGVVTIAGATATATWTDISRIGGSGPHADNHALVFNAACQLLAGDDGGLFMLSNIGGPGPLTWSDMNSNLATIQFHGVALDPTNAAIAFGGSQDNGLERFSGTLPWTATGGGDGSVAQVNPTNPQIVFQELNGHVYRSTDGGNTYPVDITPAAAGVPPTIAPFVLGPTNPARIVYGATALFETNNDNVPMPIWVRIGTPANFTPVGGTSSTIDAIAIAPSNPQVIYVTAGGHIFVTTDDGGNWAQRDVTTANDKFSAFAVDQNNPLTAYVVRNAFNTGPGVPGHVFMTTNGGVMWTDISHNLPDLPTWSVLLDSRSNPARLFVGTDAGVYASVDGGQTWASYMAGLPNVQVASLALSPANNVLAAGTYGRGMWEIQVPANLPPPAAPGAPVLAAISDTGVSNSDRITSNNGSSGKPLIFTVGNAVGFVSLYDGANLIGSATATGGTATITVATDPGLPDGVHQITATAALTPSSAQSARSAATAVTIQTSVTIIGTNPSDGSGVAVLPNGLVAVSFSHPLAGLVDGGPALDPNRDPYAVFLVARGPDLVFTGATGIDGGDLPLHANTIYHLNRDGTSTITITPLEPLSTDVYAISVNLPFFTDRAGNTLTDPVGVVPGYRSFLLQPAPPTFAPLRVVGVTSYNGFLTINNNATFQPDTIAIAFNKPLFQGAALGNNVQLLNAGNGYSVVATVAAYSPATDTIYLTPIVPLQTGTTYLVRVDGSVSDDQGNSQPGQALGQPFYDTFSLFNGPAGPGSSPLRVARSNGIPQTMPGFNTLWGAPLGYASIAFTEPLNLSPTVFGRFSAMLDQQTQGSDGNAVMENIPLNARLAFNPNTNQLIIVPTQLTGNGLFVISLSNMQATTTGDPLLNDSGQQAGVTGPPFYSPFLLQGPGGSQAALHASGLAPPAPIPVPSKVAADRARPTVSVPAVSARATRRQVEPSRQRPAQAVPTRVVDWAIHQLVDT